MKLGIKVFAGSVYSKLQNLTSDVAQEMATTYDDDVGPLLVHTAQPIAPVKTGAFRAGITYEVRPNGDNPPTLLFGGRVPYSPKVEERRPTFRPAIAQSWQKIEQLISRAIQRGLDK